MTQKRVVRIGLLGFGVVGQGVWKHLERNREALENRLGAQIIPTRAAVRDLSKKRNVLVDTERLTDDAMAVATDPEIHIVCELMGGEGFAREVTLAALRAGKTVVSANKALICKHGAEIFATARRHGGHYLFEASVAGGIPIIKTIREGLVANRFSLIYGILNGTCNYILTRMQREGKTFDEIVGDARRLGYVEADESLDLDGWDTAHKAVILAYLAHGKWIPLDDFPVEGIRHVTLDDIRAADLLGYKVKLLAVVERDFERESLRLSVYPSLIAEREIMAGVDEVYNAVSVTGDVVGTTIHIGRGAGQDATASAVISDIADAVTLLVGDPLPGEPEVEPEEQANLGAGLELACAADVSSRFYVRLTVRDRPGVLADIAAVTARQGVSIATLNQEPTGDRGCARLILTTHACTEAAMAETVGELEELEAVRGEVFLLRIAEFG